MKRRSFLVKSMAIPVSVNVWPAFANNPEIHQSKKLFLYDKSLPRAKEVSSVLNSRGFFVKALPGAAELGSYWRTEILPLLEKRISGVVGYTNAVNMAFSIDAANEIGLRLKSQQFHDFGTYYTRHCLLKPDGFKNQPINKIDQKSDSEAYLKHVVNYLTADMYFPVSDNQNFLIDKSADFKPTAYSWKMGRSIT